MKKIDMNTILIEHLKNYIYLQRTYDIRFNYHLCRQRSQKEWEQLDTETKNQIYHIFEYAVLNAYKALHMLEKIKCEQGILLACKYIRICFSEEDETKCCTQIQKLNKANGETLFYNYYIFNYCLRDVLLLYEHRLKTNAIPIMAYLGNGKYRYVTLRGIELLTKEGYVAEDEEHKLAGVGETREEAEQDLTRKRVVRFAEALL